jgi:hypothetical protein
VLLSGNPTYYTVNLTSDTGASSGTDATTGDASGDLLWAITQANNQGQPGYNPANPAGSVINFDPTVFGSATPQTITLSGTLVLSEPDGPEVIDASTVTGPITISGNNAVGVFQVESSVAATLSALTITAGSAANGAGINNSGTLTVTGSTLENSNATNDGGGIYNSGTIVALTNSSIENNNAVNEGGGIYNSGTLMVTDSTVAGNQSLNGGATAPCCNEGPGGGGIENTDMLTITNSTVADNSTNGANGGGIDNAGSLTAVNATIAYNGLGGSGNVSGGGLYDETGSSATLDNTIVALNTFYDNSQTITNYNTFYFDVAGAPISTASAYNLVGTGGSGGLTNGNNGNLVGVADPGLAAGLANTGGPTPTIALLAGSPAIAKGGSAIPGVTVPTTDQRGFARPGYSGGVVDIGAYESPVFGQPTVYTVNLTSDTGAFNGASAATATSGDLLWAVTKANANTNPAGSVIEFDPTVFDTSSPQTIRLSSTLELDESPWPEVIQGPGANALTISGNNAVAVLQVDAGATATLYGLSVSGAPSNAGPGIYNNGTLTVASCTVDDNWQGINNFGILTVANSTITDNNGGAAGAGISSSLILTVTNSTITYNTGGAGGGIEFLFMATITDSTIAWNTVTGNGGGIDGGGGLTITGCAIDHNTSSLQNGGGVMIEGGVTTITNSTIAYNAGVGGGIGGVGLMTITNSTIAYNSSTTSGSGGGLGWLAFVPLAATLNNTIIALNTDPNGEDDIQGGIAITPASSNNLVGVDETGTLTSVGSGNMLVGAANPGLGSLQNNGDPTETIALLPGSTAIGNGDPADTSADQRGAPVDSPPDIGAFQSQGFNVTAHITDPTYAAGQVGLTVSAADGPGGNQAAGFIYNIDWGDGTAQDPDITSVPRSAGNGTGVPLSHTYASPGVYTVSLTAVDEGLRVSPPATAVIVVSSTPGDNISLSGDTTAGQVVISSDTTPATVYTPNDLVFVAGEGGSDTFTVNFGSTLTTPIALAGSNSAGDTLTVNGDTSSTNVITKTPGQITWGSPVTGTVTRSGIPNTVISANGTSQNYINDPGGSTIINGGPGANTITITATTGSGAVINGGPSTNNYIVDLGSLAGPVSIQNSHSAATNNLVVNGAAGNNTIVVVGNQITAAAQTITNTASLANLTVNGGSGNNQVTVSALTVPVQNLALNGGGGSNTFTLNNVGSSVGALAISGGSGPPGNTQVQVQGSLPPTTTAQQLPPLVSAGSNATVDVWSPFLATASFQDTSAGGPYTATVNYGDGSGTQTLVPGAGNALSLSHAYAAPGTYPVTVSVSDQYGIGSGTLSVTVRPLSIYVLDATAGGALSLSGNASLTVPGRLTVDSKSASALSASGKAAVKAASIQVVGGVSKSGNATLNPGATTGGAVVADPLASLHAPTTGLAPMKGPASYSSGSHPLSPGIYSQISASGSASLVLSGGLYIIDGGGFTVSGNATITGSGVTIINAGSNYPNTGGSYGAISLSGNGSYNLTPATGGAYAGIVIFQSRDNSKAITISGNASGMTGTIYAPAAQLTESGNAQLNAAIVVDTMTVSGNGVANAVTLTSPSGTVAYSPAQIRAAYGISSLSLDGTGQTIAIVDAYDDPSIFQSVDAFDNQFGLTSSGPTLYAQYGPASSFLSVLDQYGQATSLPSTDPNGAGTDNWEVEEALDVEWAHTIAPGAQIILVEANSQSLSDLMASVATAARQPGVSMVSMSWGFAEGQAVLASDEAAYDNSFKVPGVTFVASTGDYGASDPQYPAFSPNVVAVGGTSLTLNADSSYNGETGWGYYSSAAGASIGSGGGISLYEPEPAYQQDVQSLGMRTTPDIALVADPNTGAWIADMYNLDPSNPFEVVGGTSLSAPAWAALLALVDQGRAAAGQSALNTTSPTEVQQGLYSLPQSDYNTIASGTNGYTASAGYNLVTGLGTPVANLLVPDLIAYEGQGSVYGGPTVGPLQDANLNADWTGSGGPDDVFSVFNSFTVTRDGSRPSGTGSSQQESAPGDVAAAAGGVDRLITDLQGTSAAMTKRTGERNRSDVGQPFSRRAGNVRLESLTYYPRPAQRSAQPPSSLSFAVDQVLGLVLDTDSQDTLIWDLAFDQVSWDTHKPKASPGV